MSYPSNLLYPGASTFPGVAGAGFNVEQDLTAVVTPVTRSSVTTPVTRAAAVTAIARSGAVTEESLSATAHNAGR